MKAKRLTTLFVVLFVVCALALTGCKPKHVHNYKWSVSKEANCSEEGLEIGKCKDCGEETSRPIAKNDKHDFGEWEIEKPSYEKAGKAVKLCSRNSAHKIEAVLPQLSDENDDSAYLSVTVSKEPGYFEGGEKHYVFAHSEGNVEFDVSTAAKGINSIEDAIGAAKENKNLVLGGEGTSGSGLNSSSKNSFSYEYGNNYTHIKDSGDRYERWCVKEDDGSQWGLVSNNGGSLILEEYDELGDNYAEGFRFYLTYYNPGNTASFGAENFLASLYDSSLAESSHSINSSFEKAENGDYLGSFEYGSENSGMGYYHIIKVDFSVSSDGYLKELSVVSNGYIKGVWSVKPAAEVSEEEIGAGYVYDASNDQYYIVDLEGDHYVDSVDLSQSPVKNEDGSMNELPENPYNLDEMYVQSFNAYYNDEIIENGSTIHIKADEASYISFGEFLPETCDRGFDPLDIHFCGEDGEEHGFTSIFYQNGLMMMLLNSRLMLRSQSTQLYTITIKTAKCNLEFYVETDPIAPASNEFFASVYNYVPATNSFVWEDEATKASIYLGQEINIKAYVSEHIAAYTDADFNLVVKSMPEGVDEQYLLIEEKEIGGEKVYCFTPDTDIPGDYVISVVSVKNPAITKDISLRVKEIPDLSQILTGKYSDINATYSVEFEAAEEGATNGKVTVSDSEGSVEVLSYDINRRFAVFHESGAELGYSLEFDYAYNLILTKPGAGNSVIRIALIKVKEGVNLAGKSYSASTENGNYTLNFNLDGATGVLAKGIFAHYFAYTLEISVDGKYYFKFNADAANAGKNQEGMNPYYEEMSYNNYSVVNAGSFASADGELVLMLQVGSKKTAVSFGEKLNLAGTSWTDGDMNTVEFNEDGATGVIKRGNFAHYFAYTLEIGVDGKYHFVFSADAANADKNSEMMNNAFAQQSIDYSKMNSGSSYDGNSLVIVFKDVSVTYSKV